MDKPQDRVNSPPVFRDPVYFYDDADSWIIVQDTLFKVGFVCLLSFLFSILTNYNSFFLVARFIIRCCLETILSFLICFLFRPESL